MFSCDQKLIGVQAYKRYTDLKYGEVIAEHTTSLLTSWKCTDSVSTVNLCQVILQHQTLMGQCGLCQHSSGRWDISVVCMLSPCYSNHPDSHVSWPSRWSIQVSPCRPFPRFHCRSCNLLPFIDSQMSEVLYISNCNCLNKRLLRYVKTALQQNSTCQHSDSL